MPPRRWRYGSSGKRRRSWRAVSGSSSASRTSAVSSARSRRDGRDAGRDGLHQPARDRLVAAQEVVRLEARRLERHVRGHARVPVPVRPDPRPQAQQRRSVHGPRAGPPGVARHGRRSAARAGHPSSARSTARSKRGIAMNSVSSKMASAERTSSSGVGAMARRSPVCHSSVISSRRRRRRSASSSGVVSGIVHGVEQPPDAALRDEERPATRLGGVGGQDRVDLHPGEQRHDVLAAQAGAQARDRLADGVVDRPAARPAGTRAQGADPVPLLGEVDELEVDRERVADGGELPEIEVADPGGHALAIAVRLRRGRRVVAAGRDHPAADPLHQDEQLRAALLGDHLPEERAEQPDLAAERVASAREPGARRLGGDRREPGRPWYARFAARGGRAVAVLGAIALGCRCTGAPVSRSSVTVRLQGHRPGTGPQPSSVTAAPRLGV